MAVNNIKAILKDVKVTKNGIQANFEDVQLDGNSLVNLSGMVSGGVILSVEERKPKLPFQSQEEAENTEEGGSTEEIPSEDAVMEELNSDE